MKKLRLLYIDVAFEHEPGGDKNRSRFLWQSLSRDFETEFLLLESSAAGPKPDMTLPVGIRPIARLVHRPGPFYESQSVLCFESSSVATFRRLLEERAYDLVFCRFHSPWHLACLAHEHPRSPGVVVDLDMVSSRLVGLTWRANPGWRNRWFRIEQWKLERLERRLFRQPFLIFFSNPTELEQIRERQGSKRSAARLRVLPNVMPPSPAPTPRPAQPVILFFGSMNSAANTDGFRFLVDELMPRLAPDLERHGAAIHVVGKNPPAWFRERLQNPETRRLVLVGAVDSMEATLAECRFVLLPLRIASGTRTRLLEAAAQRKAVITTTIGAEGLEVGEDAIVRDDPEQLAAAVRRLLADPSEAGRCGERLYARCMARYAPEQVGATLTGDILAWAEERRKERPGAFNR